MWIISYKSLTTTKRTMLGESSLIRCISQSFLKLPRSEGSANYVPLAKSVLQNWNMYYLTLYRKSLPTHALGYWSIFSWNGCICVCLGLDLGQKRNKGQILDVSYKEEVELVIVHPTDSQRIDERRNVHNHWSCRDMITLKTKHSWLYF